MKQVYTILIALVALTSTQKTNAQTTYTLDMGSDFSPAWTAAGTTGTASNIGGSGIDCTMKFALTGSGSIVSPYPRVNKNNKTSADFVVQGSNDGMELDINLGNKTSYVDVTYTFSAAVQNVSFAIADIDVPGGSTPYNYIDQVTITGATATNSSILPTLTKYNTSSNIFNISGNVATGNTGTGGANVSSLTQNSSDQDGTMFVSFNGYAVTSITVRYTTQNISSVATDPGLQAIAFGNISFQKATAPTTTNVSNSSVKNTNGATAISALAGTDDESISSYTITSIPGSSKGTITYNNGTSYVAVAAGQVLTPAQAASLKFTPALTYTGNAVFTFTATDNRGLVSNASNFTIPVTSSVLPVTFTLFEATLNNNAVVLTWTTQQEVNSDKFIVQKSTDGNTWVTVTEVAAAGNSNIARNYKAVDAQPASVNYYRLKEVDLDGAFIFSQVVKVAKAANNDISIKVFPNPVTNIATISTNSNTSKTVSVKVFNSNGVMVKEFSKQLNIGINNIDIPSVNTLAAGMYTVMMNNGNEQPSVARFIKQ
ncbi:MAG: T9SS type A sorting domain-containing protein [Chitinophagaceae bacterium]